MTRTEIDNNICSLPRIAEYVKISWSDGDVKSFANYKRELLATLDAAEKQLKDDLYREATR